MYESPTVGVWYGVIEAYADCSYADGVLAVGYVIYEAAGTERQLVTTGTRVINTRAHHRDIDWEGNRGEYFALVIASRAALDHTNQAFRLHTDSDCVYEAIRSDGYTFEPYFQHALYSFVQRYDDWCIECINRDDNEVAHQQARFGLKVGREIKNGRGVA